MTNCKSCGANASEAASSGSWTCGFCKTVNFVDGYLEGQLRQAAEVTQSKSVEAGVVALECGNYSEADDFFVDALKTDPKNGELWAYRAVSVAGQVNLSNIESITKQSLRCLAEAEKNRNSSANSEAIDAATATVRERLVRELLRDSARRIEQGQKIIRGYSHNQSGALAKARPKFEQAVSALAAAFSVKSADTSQMGEVAKLAVSIKRQYEVSDQQLDLQIDEFCQAIKDTHPSLFGELTDGSEGKKTSHKKSCLAAGMKLECEDGSIVNIEDLRPGQRIKTFSAKKRKHQYDPVLIIAEFRNPTLVSIHTETNSLLITPSHSVLTCAGVKKAQHLRPGDQIACQNDADISWDTVLNVRILPHYDETVFWYLTKSGNYSFVNGVVLGELTRFVQLKRIFLVKMGGWRILKHYLEGKKYILGVRNINIPISLKQN